MMVLVLQFGTVFSQTQSSSHLVSGVVLDEMDATPLPFAYLFLKNFPEFNVATDADGMFRLLYPEALKRDTLVVSLMGYAKVGIPLASLDKTDNRISLQRTVISLKEVIVKPEDRSLEEMISKAIDQIPENYPGHRHQMKGLYRKVSYNHEEVTHLVEAALVVEDVGYTKNIELAKIKVEQLRQTGDVEVADSAVALLTKGIRDKLAERGQKTAPLNPLVSGYSSNYLRIAYDPITHFGKKGGKFMGIPEVPMYHRLVGEELVGSDTVYQIAFGNTDPPGGSSYLKINSRNHAIVEYQLTLQWGEQQVYAKFREVEGRYYPEVIRLKSLRLVNRDVGIHHVDVQTFWFDQLKTGRMEKIPGRRVQKRDEPIASQDFGYDGEFWDELEFLRGHPLDAAVLQSLERNGKLEEQFKRNGKD